MKRTTLPVLCILIVAVSCLTAWQIQLTNQPAQAAPLAGSIALVAGDIIDLKWDTSVFPFTAPTYQRWELYRGLSSNSLALIASGTGVSADFYRDTGLVLNTTYYYELRAIRSDGITIVIDSAETTGGLHGKLYRDLTLKARTYQFDYETAEIELLAGSLLVVPANGTLRGYVTDDQYWAGRVYIREGAGLVIQSAGELNGLQINLFSGVLLADGATFDQNYIRVECGTGELVCEMEIENSTLQDISIAIPTIPSGAEVHLTNNRFIDTAARSPSIYEDNLLSLSAPDVTLQGNQGNFTLSLKDVSQATLTGNQFTGQIWVTNHASLTLENNTILPKSSSTTNLIAHEWATINATGNVISNTSGTSADFGANSIVTILENEFYGRLNLYDKTQANLSRNQITGHVRVQLDPAGYVTFEDNVFKGGAIDDTIYMWGSVQGSFQRNTVQNSGGWNLVWVNSNNSVFKDNCIRNNLRGLVVSGDTTYPLIDFRQNYWGAASGPYHYLLNSSGTGDKIEGTQVLFDPWSTSGTYCRNFPPQTPRPTTLSLELPSDPIRADGATPVTVRARLLDQFDQPLAGEPISLTLDPQLGLLSPTSGNTDIAGYLTASYTPPWIGDLGAAGEVELTAHSGNLSASGSLRFQKPAITTSAEPRYHQTGWPDQRALLPPDPNLFATLSARLEFDGAPLANFVVRLQLEPGSDGFFDGQLLDASDPVGELSPHEIEVRTDAIGKLWVHYLPDAQASRDNSVSDLIVISKDGFGYLDAWEVETGMDLQLVQVRRPTEETSSYVVMGEPEPLEIMVQDRLHPNYHLSKYQNSPNLISDPATQAYLHVRLDVSFPSRDTQFLDLINMAHLQVPRATSFDTYIELAPNGNEYLRTEHLSAVALRPVIIPYVENYNIYWLGINFTLVSNGIQIRDTYPIGEQDNNYALIGFIANRDSDWFEDFIANNPCAASNSAFGRNFKCVVGLLANMPALNLPLGTANFVASLCELAFDLYNGNHMNAAISTGNLMASELSNYLEDHPEKLTGELSAEMAGRLKLLGAIGQITDCYWAYTKWDEPDALQACGLAPNASMTYDQLKRTRETWTQAMMMTAGPELDGLAIYGPSATQLQAVISGATALTEISATGLLTETQGILSLATDLGSYYLFPRGEYEFNLRDNHRYSGDSLSPRYHHDRSHFHGMANNRDRSTPGQSDS